MVSGEVGLALAAVDQHRIHAVAIGHGHLRVGRESGPPKTHHARVLHRPDQLVPGHGFDILACLVEHLLTGTVQHVEDDGLGLGTPCRRSQLDAFEGAGGGGVHGHGQKAVRLGNGFAANHFLAPMHDWAGGLADVLAQGNHQPLRKG